MFRYYMPSNSKYFSCQCHGQWPFVCGRVHAKLMMLGYSANEAWDILHFGMKPKRKELPVHLL